MKRLLQSKAPMPRLSPNVGAGLDMSTGMFMKGKYNEDILIGGLGIVQGETGNPNTDKTTLAIYMMLSAMNTIAYSYMSEIIVYCSEGTLRVERINDLSTRFEFLDRDENNQLLMAFDNINESTPEEWYDKVLAPYLKDKQADKEYLIDIEFLKEPNGNKPLKVKLPTAVLIDTLTYFDPSSSIDMVLGETKKTQSGVSGKSTDSSNRTIGLNNAKYKFDVLSTLSPMALRTNTHCILNSHMGDNVDMNSSPYGPRPRQQIDSLASNEKIKGVPSNYTRLTTSLWQTVSRSPLWNSTTKLAEYPKNDGSDQFKDELNRITLKQHRCKDNISRIMVEVLSSQSEGVLPHLTNFHFLKTNKFGFEGTLQSYSLIIYPDVKLSRTTVRGLIDKDPKLRRALELQSSYLELTMYFPQYKVMGLCVGLEKLYKDIDEMGYDWNKILTMTRGWWTPKQYTSDLIYLNILNLLKLRAGLLDDYKPMLKKLLKDK